MTPRGGLALLCSLVALAGCSGGAQAPAWREREELAARVSAGEALFGTYCATCHGVEARGDGPAAQSLDPRPANLRAIARRHGGSFPAAEIAGYIDGRLRVPAHGTSAMPVWGRRFDDRNQAISQEGKLAPGAIFEIVEYLQSIQEPPATP